MPIGAGAAGGILGAGMMIGGAALGASAAEKRRRRLEELAKTPGLDLQSVIGETTGALSGGLPGAANYANAANLSSVEGLQSVLEGAIPGYSEMQKTRAGAVGSMLRGKLPADVSRAVASAATSRAMEGGYGGSAAGRNLVARDLGLTSLDILGRGLTESGRLVASTPLPRMITAPEVLNINAGTTQNLRSSERAQKLAMLMEAIQAPGSGDVWARGLQQAGGAMAGGALGGLW